jgi:hypothetical protein
MSRRTAPSSSSRLAQANDLRGAIEPRTARLAKNEARGGASYAAFSRRRWRLRYAVLRRRHPRRASHISRIVRSRNIVESSQSVDENVVSNVRWLNAALGHPGTRFFGHTRASPRSRHMNADEAAGNGGVRVGHEGAAPPDDRTPPRNATTSLRAAGGSCGLNPRTPAALQAGPDWPSPLGGAVSLLYPRAGPLARTLPKRGVEA